MGKKIKPSGQLVPRELQTAQQASLSPLVQLAMSKDIDPERLDKLLEVQISYEANEAKKAFSAAMSECQKEMPMIVKNAENKQTSSTYAKHEAVCKAVKPIYTEAGFSLSFHEGTAKQPEEIRTICDVAHSLGHSKQYYIDLPSDGAGLKGNANKTPIHAKGSTFSYGRRYLTLMIFDLATYDDNDGNTGNSAAEPAKLITKTQVNKLRKAIKDNDRDEAAFLKYIKKDSLEEIHELSFSWCMEQIKKAANNQKAKAAK